MQKTLNKLREDAQNLTVADCEGDELLCGVIATSMRQTAELLELRFKYLKVVPWNFCHADTPEGAAQFLVGATSRPLAQQDQLTQYLYYTCRSALEQRAVGGECDPLLAEEVSKVNETPLDESAGEGYHRASNCTRIRARAAKTPYIKMSTRVNQTIGHLRFLIRMGNKGKRVLRYEWKQWSRVLQTKRRSLWRKKHMSPTRVFERVYRMDAMAEENWESVAATIPAPGQGPNPDVAAYQRPTESGPLRVEYLLDVLRTQTWYQVEVPVERQDEHGAIVHTKERRHFQLLYMTSSRSRPKLMPTIESWTDTALRKQLALNVQETSVRPLPGGGGADDASVIVYADANPRWISYEDLGPWNHILKSLSHFADARGSTEHPGCMRLSGLERVRTIHPLTDLKCPTLCILSECYRRGWNPVRGTVRHDTTECGPMDGREAVAMKAYYIVLLDIHRVRPLSSSIPSDQPIAYYKLLLLGRKVEPGLGNPEYKRLLREDPADALPPIEDPGEVCPAN